MQSGISAHGRADLATVVSAAGRFIEPSAAAEALGVDAATAAQKLSRWARQGWVRRVRRGLYIAVPVEAPNPGAWAEDPLLVATRVWAPGYFTGWTAARHWGLTEQVFHTTVVRTAERVRTGKVRLLDHDYALSHVGSEHLTWGLRHEWLGDTRVSFASPARTVIEIFDDPSLGGGLRHCTDVLEQYLDEYEVGDLIAAADSHGNRAVLKRLGFLTERLDLHAPELIEASQERLSAGVSSIDPTSKATGPVDRRWRLRVNTHLSPEGHS